MYKVICRALRRMYIFFFFKDNHFQSLTDCIFPFTSFHQSVYNLLFIYRQKDTFTRIYYFINLFELQAKQQLSLEKQGFIFSRF